MLTRLPVVSLAPFPALPLPRRRPVSSLSSCRHLARAQLVLPLALAHAPSEIVTGDLGGRRRPVGDRSDLRGGRVHCGLVGRRMGSASVTYFLQEAVDLLRDVKSFADTHFILIA